MAEFTDPLAAYILTILLIVLGLAGAGYVLTDHVTGFAPSAAIIAFIGFISGLYITSNRGEWFGFMIVIGVASLILAYFLPISFVHAVAAFLIGYIIGMRTERR